MSPATQDPAAPVMDLRGRFTDGSAAAFDVAMFGVAMGVPCHSLRRTAHLAEPLMPRGGCPLTVAFYGPERAVAHGDLMGPVKAAPESSVRYSPISHAGGPGCRMSCPRHAFSASPNRKPGGTSPWSA